MTQKYVQSIIHELDTARGFNLPDSCAGIGHWVPKHWNEVFLYEPGTLDDENNVRAATTLLQHCYN